MRVTDLGSEATYVTSSGTLILTLTLTLTLTLILTARDEEVELDVELVLGLGLESDFNRGYLMRHMAKMRVRINVMVRMILRLRGDP